MTVNSNCKSAEALRLRGDFHRGQLRLFTGFQHAYFIG